MSETARRLARRIYDGEDVLSDKTMLRATAKELMHGIGKGYGKSLADVDWNSPDRKTLESLTGNIYQFAAAKNYHELRDMTDAVRDGDKIRSFEEFSQAVEDITGKYNRDWLRTEYNQAIAASQSAARWDDFKRNQADMPYLMYQCVMNSNTRPEHAALHGVIKRMDDPFWSQYMPPNGWGCRCEAIQMPGSRYKKTPDSKIQPPNVPSMFRINFGQRGIAFPEGHAYFKRLPKEYEHKVKEESRQEVRRILDNAEDAKRLKKDKDYKDVAFDYANGGLKATHVGHNFEKQKGVFGIPRGDYEKLATDGLFKNGYKVILRSEIGGDGIKQPDGFLNNVLMDIKGVEGNPLYAINRANTQKVQTCILYFHNNTLFDIDDVTKKFHDYPTWLNKTKQNISQIKLSI